MAKGHVVAHSHDVDRNIGGRAHANPILDTRMYQVEFTGSEVMEMTVKIITESMCAQYQRDQSEYLLLGYLIDCQKDNKVISLTD